MAEVMTPIEASDLNGVSLNPQDLSVDQLVGFTGYIRGLVSSLGTEADSAEGYADYLNFQKEIQEARISTFEPDMIDDDHKFEEFDLTGESDPVRVLQDTFFAMYAGRLLMCSMMNNGAGVTPFDIEKGEQFAPTTGVGLTPFDLIGNKNFEPVGPSYA